MEILAVLRRGLVTDAGDDVEARRSLLEIEMEWKQTGLTLDLHQRLMEYLQYFVAKARAGIYSSGQLPVEFFDLFSRQIQVLGTPHIVNAIGEGLMSELRFLDIHAFELYGSKLLAPAQIHEVLRDLDLHLYSYLTSLSPFLDDVRRDWILMIMAQINLLMNALFHDQSMHNYVVHQRTQ